MPHAKATAMREMSVEEMQARVGELREELFNLRFRNSMKQLDNPLKMPTLSTHVATTGVPACTPSSSAYGW